MYVLDLVDPVGKPLALDTSIEYTSFEPEELLPGGTRVVIDVCIPLQNEPGTVNWVNYNEEIETDDEETTTEEEDEEVDVKNKDRRYNLIIVMASAFFENIALNPLDLYIFSVLAPHGGVIFASIKGSCTAKSLLKSSLDNLELLHRFPNKRQVQDFFVVAHYGKILILLSKPYREEEVWVNLIHWMCKDVDKRAMMILEYAPPRVRTELGIIVQWCEKYNKGHRHTVTTVLKAFLSLGKIVVY